MNDEARFIAGTDLADAVGPDSRAATQALREWLAQFQHALAGHRLDSAWPQAQAPLARAARALDAGLRRLAGTWTAGLAELEPARQLAESCAGQIMLLVFGKFNAGKSSLCNFLAQRHRAHGRQVRFFHVGPDGVCDSETPLREGATETTRRLQGVRLGDRLVLLDTPGLHSGEQANAALTRRYLDSADGVLWLTGSSSPGQVRELDDLGRELLRRKPLLPIITRSDCYDEDEVDGEIRKTLCNKSAADRDLQQADVESRARGKLAELGADPGLLKTPVSISVRMASAQTPAAMAEAGFDALYAALRALIQPMLAYRQRKPAEMLLHYLQENVAGPIARDIRPGLDALRRQAQAALAWQQDQRTRLAEASLRRILPALPALLDNPAADLPASLARMTLQAYAAVAAEALADYRIDIPAALPHPPLDRHAAGSDPWQRYSDVKTGLRASLLRLEKNSLDQCHGQSRAFLETLEALDTALEAGLTRLAGLARRLREEGAALPRAENAPAAD